MESHFLPCRFCRSRKRLSQRLRSTPSGRCRGEPCREFYFAGATFTNGRAVGTMSGRAGEQFSVKRSDRDSQARIRWSQMGCFCPDPSGAWKRARFGNGTCKRAIPRGSRGPLPPRWSGAPSESVPPLPATSTGRAGGWWSTKRKLSTAEAYTLRCRVDPGEDPAPPAALVFFESAVTMAGDTAAGT